MNEVTEGLAGFILQNKDFIGPSGISINSVLGEIKQELKNVWDYEPESMQSDDMPSIALGLPEFENEWLAAPYTIQTQWSIPIVCRLVFDDNLNNSRAIKRFAKAVERLFQDTLFQTIPITPEPTEITYNIESYAIYYMGQVPIRSGTIEYEAVETGLFLRRATLNWVGYTTRQLAPGYNNE